MFWKIVFNKLFIFFIIFIKRYRHLHFRGCYKNILPQTPLSLGKEIIFADNFKKFRKLRGISQKEFSERLFELTGKKLTLTSVSNYETGIHMPPPQVLPFVASILEVSIDALFGTKQAELVIEDEPPVQENALEKWKEELSALEKDFYYLKITQAKALKDEALPVMGCCEKLLDLSKKQQDELLVLQTELATIRKMFSFLQGKG